MGWAFLTCLVLWWQWSFTHDGYRLRGPLWLGAVMLAMLGWAGYMAAGLRGLEASGQFGHAALAMVLFVPALMVAATDRPQERGPEPTTTM